MPPICFWFVLLVVIISPVQLFFSANDDLVRMYVPSGRSKKTFVCRCVFGGKICISAGWKTSSPRWTLAAMISIRRRRGVLSSIVSPVTNRGTNPLLPLFCSWYWKTFILKTSFSIIGECVPPPVRQNLARGCNAFDYWSRHTGRIP